MCGMARCTALVLGLLCAAAGAASAASPLACTPGSLKLDLVAPSNTSDPIAKCLTSLSIDIADNCSVSLAPLSAGGSYVNGLWSAEGAEVYPLYLECPSTPSAPVPAAGSDGAGGTAQAVQAAVLTAFQGFVYGLEGGKAKLPLAVDSVTFYPGKAVVKRGSGVSLTYAITEASVAAAVLSTDSGSAVSVVQACSELSSGSALAGRDVCLGASEVHLPCSPASYGIVVGPETNPLKVCSLCPAGTTGDGYGCTPCPAGQTSDVGGGVCRMCGPGTYTTDGSSTCLPCPTGTYNDKPGAPQCKECPSDSFAWIPGSIACLRCINGVPEECAGDDCGPAPSAPGGAILMLGQMETCGLDKKAGEYEVKAWTKCSSWREEAPALQLALAIAGDCSIQISPITDPSCADPTDESGHPYGSIQLTAYYQTPTKIRTLMASDNPRSLMMAIDPVGESSVDLVFFPATTDPASSSDLLLSTASACRGEAEVTGGMLAGLPENGAIEDCPDGSYLWPEPLTLLEIEASEGDPFLPEAFFCRECPVGSSCSGNNRTACPSGTFNHILGLGGDCTGCPLEGGLTSNPGASQCGVEAFDTDCMLADTSGMGMEWDRAAQACRPCCAGTSRDDMLKACVDCPAGSYSAEGAASCAPCPSGQHSPADGLPDQEESTGLHCVACPRGSLALSFGAAGPKAQVQPGATYCDPCPANTYQDTSNPQAACMPCPEGESRELDATPENNECRALLEGEQSRAAQGRPGQEAAGQAVGTRCPAGTFGSGAAGQRCTACPTNTFSARGATNCTKCPSGTSTLGQTGQSSCQRARPQV